MKVTGKVYHAKVKAIDKAMQTALVKSVDALRDDLIQSQTMPFAAKNGGELQNRSTSVDAKEKEKGHVRLVTDTPYARRLYFHPEYNFNKSENPNAQGLWLETYITGAKKDFLRKAFTTFLKKSGEV